MAAVESKKANGQKGYGSPAQIRAERNDLAEAIFSVTLPPREWASKFEQLNRSAMESEGAPDSPGFKSPMAECGVCSHTTQHNTTQHNTMM